MEYLTRREAAQELGVSVSTIIRLWACGELEEYRPVGTRVFITRESVSEFRRRHTAARGREEA